MSSKHTVVVYLSITAACIAVYFKCLFFGITNSDDEVLIAGNLPFLHDFSNILTVFTTDAFYQVKSIDLYRPLQSASYIMDAQWGLPTVFIAHLSNLFLHIFSCLAVFHLLQRLHIRRRLAFCGALVYAVHYLFMTAVAWIPARGDLLLSLFTFLTLLTFIRLLEKGTWRYYLLHCLCFTLAVFSKESAVVLPFLLLLYVYTYAGKEVLTKRTLVLPGYYAAIITLFFVLKTASVTFYSGAVGLVPFLKNIRALPECVAKFYLPLNMSTLPEFKLSATLAGLLLLSALLALTVHYRLRLGRRALFGIAWFLLFIIPGMTYYPNFYSFGYEHIDHRSYLTCFGLLLLNLQLVQLLELDGKKYFRAAMALLLVWLAAANLYFSASYRNAAAFAFRAITTNPNSAKAFANYGAEKFLQGDELDALRYLNRSIYICDKFMPALHYRARIYRNRGMNRAALADLDNIFSVDPEYDAADYALRAAIKINLQDYAGARNDFRMALRLDPTLTEAAKGMRELPVGAPR